VLRSTAYRVDCLISLLSVIGGCSYESSRRAHRHPLEASFMGQPVSLRSFSAGTSAQWRTFWFAGATEPTGCDSSKGFLAKEPEPGSEVAEFSIAIPAKLWSTGRHEIRPDPTMPPQVTGMMKQRTAHAQAGRGINGGAFYIDKISDDYVDIAMDVDDNLVRLVGTFRASRCRD
jgi:hypothetical protein